MGASGARTGAQNSLRVKLVDHLLVDRQRCLGRTLCVPRMVSCASKLSSGGRVFHRDPDDSLWARSRMTEALEPVQAPIVLQGGWHDGFLRQTMQQYARLSERGVDVALTSGPGTHVQAGTKGSRILMAEAGEWLDEHLAGSGRASRALPVKVFVRGPGGDGATLPPGHRRRSSESSTPRATHALPTRRPTRKRRQVHL